MNAHRSAVTGQWSLRLACLVAVCLTAVPAFAQFDRGQISGVIKDSSGGVVPGATVTATQPQSTNPRVTVTDASGFYTFANLAVGTLRHQRRAPGLQESRQGRRAARRRRRR